jgi:lipopolysaccharide/colanic/teichoic acid biosynthesis glycosyltransferase
MKKPNFIVRNLKWTAVIIVFAGLMSLIVKNVVYAQTDWALSPLSGLSAWGSPFSWLMGGGLVSIFIDRARKNYQLFKRGFDILISLVGLVLLSPLFLIVVLLIKIDSYGPVFFRQERVGEKGKLFKIWKFRSMRVDAELETGPVWAQDDDPRITRLGSFLRKSHIDELPQLANMLKGDMSLVGPRPERPELLRVINEQLPDFPKRLEIKPGLTGLAQVRYRYGATIKDASRKLKYDILYTGKMGWFLDFRILYWTLGKVVTGEGAR